MNKKPVALIIMDGFGISENEKGNAIKAANKPNLDRLMAEYPTSTIKTSGLAVGLPEGQMGNSEVGHLNIGAGHIVYQSLTLINKSIKDGTFFENEKYLNTIKSAINNNKKLHIFGLLSDGGVHSHINHIKAIFKMAKNNGLNNVYLHAFMDGRDVDPNMGADYLEQMQQTFDELGVGCIASISGRYYAMDRDKNMDRIDVAYKVL